MNRRERRRRAKSGSRLAKLAAVLIVVCLVGTAVLYIAVRNYLHGDSFRLLLSEKVSAAAKVKGEFTPFRWDGLSVDTHSFQATGDGPIRSMRIDGLHTEVKLGGIRRGVWQLDNSRALRLAMTLDARGAAKQEVDAAVKSAPKREEESDQGWLPSKVEVTGLDVQDISLDVLTAQGTVSASGMQVDVERGDGPDSHRAQISGGTLVFPQKWMPAIRMERARIDSRPQGVFLTNLSARAWSGARVDASGEWDRITRRVSVEGAVNGVKCEELLSEDWSRRLSGGFSSTFVVQRYDGRTSANGRLVLENGILTALPVLDVLAAYADTRRFRTLALSEAHADWRWRDGELVFENLVLASESLIRLEGRLGIRNRQLDGTFMLGMAPGTLATVPGAETHVFLPGSRGMLWAPLRITGTLDKPREDLSDRMIAAAGLRLLETMPGEAGKQVLKFSQTVLGDNPIDAVDQGVKIIEEGGKTVRDVGNLLDGILGGGSEPEPEENE